MNRGVKTAADYAAIAVAPVLIFIMISSLVNFLTLVVYRGNFPERIQWTFLMVTFGSVAAARLSIEQDRAKSLTYLLALAGAAFFVLTRFRANPIFSVSLLGLIVWLSDVIVRDCTLIDDSKDASDQGLIQSAKDGRRRGHRPGRTILFLAMAALPLFGIGQFFLRSYSGAWIGAQKLLALYLFAALSLLVTTSFLGLRRYLRQRGSEMPRNVTIAWLVGGLLMVMTILFIATLAPLPGQAIASMEIPEWMTVQPDEDPGASKHGWGNEGTENDTKGAAKVESRQPNSEPKQAPTQKDAPPGAAKQGDSQTGPPGEKSGGKSPASGDGKQEKGGASRSKEKPSQSKTEDGQKSSSQDKPKDSEAAKQNDPSAKSDAKADPQQQAKGETRSEEPSPSDEPKNGRSDPANQKDKKVGQDDSSRPDESERGESNQDNPSNDSDGEQQPADDGQSSDSDESMDPDGLETPPNNDPEETPAEKTPVEKNPAEKNPAEKNPTEEPPAESQPETPAEPSGPSVLTQMLSLVGSLLKPLILLGCLAVVGFFLRQNWSSLVQWWNNLFNRDPKPSAQTSSDATAAVTSMPPKPFASYRNPFQTSADPRESMLVTFSALEAFARERGLARAADETPSEFYHRMRSKMPELATNSSVVIDAYNRLLYGGLDHPTAGDLRAAESLWREMQTN